MKENARASRRRATLVFVAGLFAAMFPSAARAGGPRLHVMAGGANAVGGPQQTELGPGGGGTVAGEYGLGRHVGLQVEGSALALSHRAPPADPRIADRSTGVVLSAMGGVRLGAGGLWIDANCGLAQSGSATRPVFDTHLGFDFRTSQASAWTVGPFLGYTQVFQDPDALRPEDAHVAWLGVHVSFGARPERPEVPILAIAKAAPPQVAPQDAPQVAPPVAPPDRDHDGVLDTEDACPDVPGERTADPSTNGCPSSTIHMIGDRIELNDIIHFDTASSDVKRVSWPLIQNVAKYINARGDVTSVDIEGHADERGDTEYNQRLSEERAASVKKLLERFGVSAAVVARGFGESLPRRPGHAWADYLENRRVEFFVTQTRAVQNAPNGETAHASK